MAAKDEVPPFNPKHRIVVALAVILVPLILDEHEPPPELKSVTEIPPPKTASAPPTETRVVITPVSEMTGTEKSPVTPAAAPPSAGTPAPVKPAPASVTEKPPVKTAEEKAEPVVKPVRSAGTEPATIKNGKGWVVQVGVYKERTNAERLRERLQGQGFKVSAEPVNLDGARATRLRLGPYRDRASALKMQARLEKEAGVKSVVYANPQK
jgi:DedD protein